jgi:hypothetical protein
LFGREGLEVLAPFYTYQALLVIQAVHLIHHRLAKRHISFVEGFAAVVLCFPPFLAAEREWLGWAMISVHITLILIQVAGSLFIKRLSPDWSRFD